MVSGKLMPKNNTIISANAVKKRKLWKHGFLFAVILLAASGLVFCFIKANQVRKNDEAPDCSKIKSHLKHGDIILRSGIGFWSELFRNANDQDKRFSHVGVIVKKRDGDFLVIHAEADDYSGKGVVKQEKLDGFVKFSNAVGISRLKKGDPEKFCRSAVKYIGKPFDWKFNKDDETEIYCTELIDLALKSSGITGGLKASSGLLLPESCLDPENFQEIIPESFKQ